MKKSKKVLSVLLIVALAVCVVGTTLAWLQDETDTVQNTFAPSTVGLELEESETEETTDEDGNKVFTKDYKLVPGYVLAKDPTVTVEAGSEDCWVFVEITESENLDTFIDYTVNTTNWEQLKDAEGNAVENVYCKKVTGLTAEDAKPEVLEVLENNEVTVKDVTKTDMEGLSANNYPTLTFKAYAVQLMKNQSTEHTAFEAWGLAIAE